MGTSDFQKIGFLPLPVLFLTLTQGKEELRRERHIVSAFGEYHFFVSGHKRKRPLAREAFLFKKIQRIIIPCSCFPYTALHIAIM